MTPGESFIAGPSGRHDLVNVIEFGGAVDRVTHVPSELGSVGPVVFWQSTGAAWPGGSLRTPRHFFSRGLAALVAYEMHLEHNEFEGGLIVHDLGDRVSLKAGGYSQTLAGSTVLAGFAGLLEHCR